MELEKEIERDIAVLHTIAGMLFGVVTGLYVNNPDLNIINVLLLGLLVSYPLMPVSKKLFWSEMEFKQWLAKGFSIFFAVWIVVWIFVYNLT